MRTSHAEDLDSHAVVGGGEAQSFAMSDTAEFFTILSDTLYSDKPRACVREVLCNAWDAHTVAGRKDVTVQVIVTENTLTISDAGPGIPHDKIRDIYCTYGNSTKADDDNQTGGFGLGSKAPFAISDHFTVTNTHGGRRKIYAISRGGVETDGKPGFRVMVDTPAVGETGVSVSVPFRDDVKVRVLENLVREIACNGGMNVVMNGKKVAAYDFERGRALGYAVIPEIPNNTVMLSYGSVLYPLAGNDEVHKRLGKVRTALGGKHLTLVLFARPGTVGVTPSRESLSWTDRTKAAVNALINRLDVDTARHGPKQKREAVFELMTKGSQAALRGERLGVHCRRALTTLDTPETVVRAIVGPTSAWMQSRALGSKKSCAADPARHAVARLYPAFRARIMRGENATSLSWRLPLRIAARTGYLKRLYGIRLHEMGFVKAREVKAPAHNVLILAERQKDAIAFRAANDTVFYKHWYENGRYGFFPVLIVPAGNEAARAEIERLAIRYGIRLFVAPRVRTEKKSAEKAETGEDVIPVLALNEDGWLGNAELGDEKFFAYVGRGDGTLDKMPDRHAVKTIGDAIGDCVIVQSAEHRDALAKRGLRNVRDVLEELCETHAKSRAVQWGFETHSSYRDQFGLRRLWPGGWQQVDRLIDRRPDLLPVFWPVRRPKGQNAEAEIEIGRLLAAMQCAGILSATRPLLDAWRKNPLLPADVKADPGDPFMAMLDVHRMFGPIDADFQKTALLAGLRAARKFNKKD